MSTYKSGQVIKAKVPFRWEVSTIHIEHVIELSKSNHKLIIYRVFGTQKRWWHYISCFDYQMDMYVKDAKNRS